MVDAPRCKLCGAKHWLNAPHVFSTVTPNVTAEAIAVTTSVTKSLHEMAAIPPSEHDMIAAITAPEHECPICGLLHHKPKTHAERQREYRGRQGV